MSTNFDVCWLAKWLDTSKFPWSKQTLPSSIPKLSSFKMYVSSLLPQTQSGKGTLRPLCQNLTWQWAFEFHLSPSVSSVILHFSSLSWPLTHNNLKVPPPSFCPAMGCPTILSYRSQLGSGTLRFGSSFGSRIKNQFPTWWCPERLRKVYTLVYVSLSWSDFESLALWRGWPHSWGSLWMTSPQ